MVPSGQPSCRWVVGSTKCSMANPIESNVDNDDRLWAFSLIWVDLVAHRTAYVTGAVSLRSVRVVQGEQQPSDRVSWFIRLKHELENSNFDTSWTQRGQQWIGSQLQLGGPPATAHWRCAVVLNKDDTAGWNMCYVNRRHKHSERTHRVSFTFKLLLRCERFGRIRSTELLFFNGCRATCSHSNRWQRHSKLYVLCQTLNIFACHYVWLE